MDDFETYCAICAGPTEEVKTRDDQNMPLPSTWLTDIVLIHRKEHMDDLTLLEIPAEGINGPYYEILATGETITACDVVVNPWVNPPRPLYIACHKECIFLVKKATGVLEHLTMERIWQLLVSSFNKAAKGMFRPLCNIYTGRSYGNICIFQEMRWSNNREGSGLHYEAMHFEANPVEISDLADGILCHLQLLPTDHLQKDQQSVGDQQSIGSTTLPKPKDLSLPCTFDLPPNFWRDLLVEGKYLPWLWDISQSTVTLKESHKPEDRTWNWEQLVRQLAQPNLYSPRAVLPDLPIGLRNRHRIWRVLEDMVENNDD